MKAQLIYDIFLGFILLSIWLNFINGYLPALIESFSEQFKLSLYSLMIICLPSLVDFTFNYSEKSSKTFSTSILSAGITLIVREIFVWWKERNDIQEEIFSELYGNYRSLNEFVQLSRLLEQHGVTLSPAWNGSISPKWIDQTFKSHFGKLQSKKIYSQEIINDLRAIYESMNLAIRQIENHDPNFADNRFVNGIFLGAENSGILSQIRDLLIRLDEKKAYQVL
jgi:energy-converting hydrogenase Eha subunit A